MPAARRFDIPATVWVPVLVHLGYGLAALTLLPVLQPWWAEFRPLVTMAWAGTAAMLALAGFVQADADWPRNGRPVMTALLLPDLALIVLALSAP